MPGLPTPRVKASAQTGPWSGSDIPLASRSSRQMAVAARAFLNGLPADQLGRVQYANLGDPARTQWSNFPAGAAPRPGVALGDLSESQRQVLHDLQGGNPMFGIAHYYTTVFGSPEDATWAWMLTGHHMNAMFTVAGDR